MSENVPNSSARFRKDEEAVLAVVRKEVLLRFMGVVTVAFRIHFRDVFHGKVIVVTLILQVQEFGVVWERIRS